ncbi:MAG: flavodoxin [Idiomarina sp.]|nr:MAG: flavodoxin [Idiomarina sp.]
MQNIDILVATTSGNTEYLADQLSNQLQEAGYSTTLHYEPDYSDLMESLTDQSVWLCCVASHGAGEYADSMLDFAEELHTHKPQLAELRFGVIAVGDSCYDTFCAAGRDCDAMLAILGAKRLITHLEIDMSQDDPDEKSSTWLQSFIQSL